RPRVLRVRRPDPPRPRRGGDRRRPAVFRRGRRRHRRRPADPRRRVRRRVRGLLDVRADRRRPVAVRGNGGVLSARSPPTSPSPTVTWQEDHTTEDGMATKSGDDWRQQGKQVVDAFAEGVEEIRDGITQQTAKHEDTIKDKLGKVTDFLDEKTGGKYTDKLGKANSRLA